MLYQLVDLAGFESWQEAAEHGKIRDWYDDEGNWIAGDDKSLVGMSFKAPTDIYTANFKTFSGSLIEYGIGPGIAFTGSFSEVVVENARTNDAFSTMLYSAITDTEQAGFALKCIDVNTTTLYGKFPSHYSDFISNPEHRDEMYRLGDSKVEFFNFVLGSYSRVESDYWRGSGWGKGLTGFSVGFGRKTELTLERQIFGNIKNIPAEETLAKRQKEIFQLVALGNSSGLARVHGPNDPKDVWMRYQQGVKERIEKEYLKYWGND